MWAEMGIKAEDLYPACARLARLWITIGASAGPVRQAALDVIMALPQVMRERVREDVKVQLAARRAMGTPAAVSEVDLLSELG
jgi:hypothetical protein